MLANTVHRIQRYSPRVAALSVILALTLLPIASPAAAQSPVPFKGDIQATEISTVNFPNLSVSATGSGNATHLGRFSVTYQVQVNLITIFGVDSYQFTAANGDILYAQGTGQGFTTSDPTIDTIVEHNTITGGTGRFAGATGSFTLVRQLNLATGATAGTFDGNIVLAH